MNYFVANALLETPVVVDDYIPFDSLIYYILAKEKIINDNPKNGDLKIKIETQVAENLPLLKIENFYACSVGLFNNLVSVTSWTKKFPVEYTKYLKNKKIKINQGVFKEWNQKIEIKSTKKITWYGVGDIQKIKEIINKIKFIGKKTAQGFGKVRQWEITETRINDDWRQRALPEDYIKKIEKPMNVFCGKLEYRLSAVIPPYYRADVVPCYFFSKEGKYA